MSRTIALLARGGDYPGLNTLIRAVVGCIKVGFDELVGTAEALDIGAGR